MGVGGDLHLMGHQSYRDAACAVQADEHLHQVSGSLRIEGAGRLVGQDQRRVRDQRAGDGDALLLAAGKLCRAVMSAMPQPHLSQRM